jgi:C_GCAxxG_C_C family probable redox protein
MATDHAQRALELFDQGYNCSQSVFSAYAEESGLDPGTARRVASGFGGGIGRTGNLCGAVSGAIMAIGLLRGINPEEDPDWREKIYALDNEFIQRFTERFGSLQCPALLGFNMAVPEENAEAKKSGAVQKVCPVLIAGATEILDELLSPS